MRDVLLSRFANAALVAPEMRQVFEGCLAGAAGVDKISTMLEMRVAADDGFWPSPDSWMAQYRPYIVNDAILQIPVKGVLLNDFGFQVGNWLTGYKYILRAFQRGMEDANVKGIALIVHSPGGVVAECFDVVDKMFAMRGTKPVRAFAAEAAYSGAYAIASVADIGRFNVSRTGGVGSIGVVTTHMDVSQAMANAGYKITFVHAGKHKVDGNPYQPLPEDVKARYQAHVNDLWEVFINTVARNRGLNPKKVKDTEAACFGATEAVSNGLADTIGTLDDALAAYAVDLSTPDDGEDEMSKQDESAANQAAIDQARAEGVESGRKEGVTQGATAERARINAIIDSDEGKKRPKAAASAALKTGMTVDEAKAFLVILPEEKAEVAQPAADAHDSSFVKIMNASEQPNAGVDKGGDKDKPHDILASAGYGAPKK
ncbi:MAG TPA: S49 family peptidase [Reyranella sp.]|nr:S49 family peptidase [Reyranella sp.]